MCLKALKLFSHTRLYLGFSAKQHLPWWYLVNFTSQTIFCKQHFFGPKIFLDTSWDPKIILDLNFFFWYKIFLWTKNLVWYIFGSKKFWFKDLLRTQKFFWPQNIFWPQTFLDQKYFWTKLFSYTKSSLGTQYFFWPNVLDQQSRECPFCW